MATSLGFCDDQRKACTWKHLILRWVLKEYYYIIFRLLALRSNKRSPPSIFYLSHACLMQIFFLKCGVFYPYIHLYISTCAVEKTIYYVTYDHCSRNHYIPKYVSLLCGHTATLAVT